MSVSVYIHIPFCLTKCKYCSFVSYTCIEQKENYINSLICEIKDCYRGEPLKTLYFGGGTPSLLKVTDAEKLLKLFNIDSNCEITFEMNPGDGDILYLRDLHSIGVNRLSIGVQTFNDNILKYIGRRHNAKTSLRTLDAALASGFRNISMDLMYGLPYQDLDSISNDLSLITSMEIKHVSTYGLKVEEPSYFYYNHPQNLPDDDFQADAYLMINETLENNGFKRYEISNFAKKGYESQHNLNYWSNNEYYGFGASAHGYINNIRYSNYENLSEYILNCPQKANEHSVNISEKLEEEIFLGFRKESGLNIYNINNAFGINFEQKYKDVLEKYSGKYIEKTPSGYKLTLKGVLLSNIILSEFIED